MNKYTKLKQAIKILIERETLGKITKNISIVFELEMTDHAVERQFRHLNQNGEGEIINKTDIKNLIDKAIPTLINALITNEIDIDEKIHLKQNRLNLIVVLNETNIENQLKLKIVTTMLKYDFKVSDTISYTFA